MSKEPTLSELIADKKGDRSYDTLAEDCGGAPSRQRLHQLLTKELRNFPDPVSIEGLARGLVVPVTDVIMASARSLGLRVYSGNDPDALLIGGAGKLPSTAKDTVIRVARQFLELTSQLADGRADEDSSAAASGKTSGGEGRIRDYGRAPIEPNNVTPIGRGHARDQEVSELYDTDAAADTVDEGGSASDGFYPEDPDPFNLRE